MKAILSIAFGLLLSLAHSQDCNRFTIFEVRDSVFMGQKYVSFKMTTDTLQLYSTGYTTILFVNQFADTVARSFFQAHLIPPNPDTVDYLIPYANGFSTLPVNFDGNVIFINPDCTIPFDLSAISSQEEKLSDAFLKIFPNPAAQQISIKVSEEIEIKAIVLFDSRGKEIRSFPKDLLLLNVAGLAIGNYTLSIETKQGTFQEKIVVQ